MTYFPMFVSLEKKKCLIIGGGKVAVRKCKGLLAFGADVTMIAKEYCPEASECPTNGLHKIEKLFEMSDLSEEQWQLVIAATNDRSVNSAIAAFCRKNRIPVNVADCREECTFFFPAYAIEENVAVGITTSGVSPSMAAALRQRLEKELSVWIKEQQEKDFV